MYQNSNLAFKSPHPSKESLSKGFKRKSHLLNLQGLEQQDEYHPTNNNKKSRPSIYYDHQQDPTTPSRNSSFRQTTFTNRSEKSNGSLTGRSIRSKDFSISGQDVTIQKKYDHQLTLLKKQIQKLKKQISKKQEEIKSLQMNKAQFKQIQTQLVETYRIINYYEGKSQQQDKIIKFHEGNYYNDIANKAKNRMKQGLDFKDVVEFFKNQSIELKGELQKKNHQFIKTSNQLRSIETKYYQIQKKYNAKIQTLKSNINEMTAAKQSAQTQQKAKIALIYENRLEYSKNKIGKRKSDQELSMASSVHSQPPKTPFKYKQASQQQLPQFEKSELAKIYGNFNSKINKIEQDLDFFKIQNQKLSIELNQKIKQVGRLLIENDELKHLINQSGKGNVNDNQEHNKLLESVKFAMKRPVDPLNQVTILPTMTLTKRQSQSFSTRSTNYRQPIKRQSSKGKQLIMKQVSQKPRSQNLIKRSSYTFKQIKEETIRRLRYNLIRQDITYNKLIDVIVDQMFSEEPNNILQVLQDVPYQLSSKQSSEFLFEFKKLKLYLHEQSGSKNINQPRRDLSQSSQRQLLINRAREIFRENIRVYKNITLRKDASMMGQISKIFKNRLQQIQVYLKDDKKNELQFKQVQRIFKQEWGLSEQQIEFICLKSCEQSQEYIKFNFPKTISFFLQN